MSNLVQPDPEKLKALYEIANDVAAQHPLLLDTVIKFQVPARGELLPSEKKD